MTKRGYYKKRFDLSGKIAVVTGATGILGRHFCAGLADHGAQVAAVDIDGAAAVEFASELTATYKVQCAGFGCDVADPGMVAETIAAIEENFGSIDILHNNAATKGSSLEKFFAPPEDYDLCTWREIMAVNLDGLFLVAREVGHRMAQRRRGSIIQTASIYGILAPDQRIYEGSEYMNRPINTPPVYTASKAGVVGLTKYLASYWGSHGVRVNTLTPGGVESGQNEVFISRYSARVPLGRMAQAEEMVGALVFLASDASSYITGQNIVVDGGLSSW